MQLPTRLGPLLLIILFSLFNTACSSLPTEIRREPSTAFADAPGTSLGRLLVIQSKDHPDNSGFYLLDTGKEAFQARLALLELA